MAKPEPIIFLDIDGPVITPRMLVARAILDENNQIAHGLSGDFARALTKYHYAADPMAVALISDLAVKTAAKIVISSTMRLKGYDKFIAAFKEFGFEPSLLHKDWRTTERGLIAREDEIKAWLARNPEHKVFVTIDDEVLDFDCHVQVCAMNGFLMDNYAQAFEKLTGGPAPKTYSMYNVATVDYLGPKEYVENDVALKRGVDRMKARKEELHSLFAKPNPK